MRLCKIIPVVCAAVLLAGCASLGPVAPPVTPAMTAANGTPAATLNAGREIFSTRCTTCHNADPVRAYDADDWRRIVGRMAARSKLQPAERAALLAYLTAAQEPRAQAAR